MWEEGERETDLIRLLGTLASAANGSKFLLATSELMQFRHFTETQANINNDDSGEGEDG